MEKFKKTYQFKRSVAMTPVKHRKRKKIDYPIFTCKKNSLSSLICHDDFLFSAEILRIKDVCEIWCEMPILKIRFVLL